MSVAIRRDRPIWPNDAEMHTRRPVYGRTVGSLADLCNHLTGCRMRRCYTASYDYPLGGSGIGQTLGTVGSAYTYRYRHRADWDAQYLFVAFTYFARPDAEIVLSAADITGAHSVGLRVCTWSAITGTLRTARHDDSAAIPEVATTGFSTAPHDASSYQPRLVPLSGFESSPRVATDRDIVLDFDVVYARIYSICVWELYTELVEHT